MLCERCGAELKPQLMLCTSCGMKFRDKQQPPPPPVRLPPPPQQRTIPPPPPLVVIPALPPSVQAVRVHQSVVADNSNADAARVNPAFTDVVRRYALTGLAIVALVVAGLAGLRIAVGSHSASSTLTPAAASTASNGQAGTNGLSASDTAFTVSAPTTTEKSLQDAVQMGMSENAVTAALGAPDEARTIADSTLGPSTVWEYDRNDGTLLVQFAYSQVVGIRKK